MTDKVEDESRLRQQRRLVIRDLLSARARGVEPLPILRKLVKRPGPATAPGDGHQSVGDANEGESVGTAEPATNETIRQQKLSVDGAATTGVVRQTLEEAKQLDERINKREESADG